MKTHRRIKRCSVLEIGKYDEGDSADFHRHFDGDTVGIVIPCPYNAVVTTSWVEIVSECSRSQPSTSQRYGYSITSGTSILHQRA